jgi:hypothetical protein
VGRESRLRKQKQLPAVSVDLGPAGLPQFMTIVGATADRALSDPRGSAGLYSAVLTLSRPGIRPLPEYNQTPSDALEGDSHVAITKPAYSPPGNSSATEIRATTATEVLFSGLPNRRGFLAGFKVYPFEASDFHDAYVKAYARVAPSLSTWSAHLDLPLNVFQVDVVELASNARMIASTNPYPEMTFAGPPGLDKDEDLAALVSIYREALTSSSLTYQFLCFYKIAEALKARRDRLAKAARRRGEKVTRVVEVVPADAADFEAWLGAIFPAPAPRNEPFRAMYYETYLPLKSRGKSFDELLGLGSGADGVLKGIRDRIAHGLVSAERGQPFVLLNLDDRLFHREIHGWLPLMKVITRRMLKTDFPGGFMAHLDG